MQSLIDKKYKNEFTSAFPGDDSGDPTPRQTPGVLYSKALPTPVKAPKLLAWSDELAQELAVEKPSTDDDVAVLAGNMVTPSMYPYAYCYAGHQFGHWAGQLGDGRAITLGEWQAPGGATWELQLKGAGITPYSRTADGRAVLRSSVREYLMSEAMHYLGVPTTRALSLVTTGEQVLRDMFYNGNPDYEPGAIVMRVAPTFLRFGNYEMPAARKELGNLKNLVDWTIDRYYPHIQGEDKVVQWFREVMVHTAVLMVEWMRVGFVHGVMNTDNMSILGLTIDYGPYSFVDELDLNFTPNTTDLPGRRYAFGRQPAIAQWNLGCLAGALAPLLPDTKPLVAVLEEYADVYWDKYYTMMGNKLGLDKVRDEDITFINEWNKVIAALKPDMTIFYQLLIDLPDEVQNKEQVVSFFKESFYSEPGEEDRNVLYQFMVKYSARIKHNNSTKDEWKETMRAANPRFVLRNYLLHEAIEGLEKGDDSLFVQLQQAIKEPYTNKYDEFFKRRPDWAAEKAGCSMLSCSS